MNFQFAIAKDLPKGSEDIVPKKRVHEMVRILNNNDYILHGGRPLIRFLIQTSQSLPVTYSEQRNLDIGCNFGGSTNDLAQYSHIPSWGIDIDAAAIDYAKQHYSIPKFTVADAAKLTDIFDDNYFSHTYLLETFTSVRDQAATLQKIKAVTQSKGLIFIVEYSAVHNQRVDDHSGAPMKLLDIEQTKKLARYLNLKIVKVVDISNKYTFWCREMLEKFPMMHSTLENNHYTDFEINFVYQKFTHLIKLLEQKNISATLLILQK